MSTILRGLITAAVLATGVAQAYAAEVRPRGVGPVTVNSIPIRGPVRAQPGAQVAVRGEGSALIVHDNGCTQLVPAYSSDIVQSDPVCDTGTGAYPWKGKLILGATGIILGVIAYELTNDNKPRMSP